MTAAFWLDPPWRSGQTPFRMGLREITEAEWLPDPICRDEYRRKSMLLTDRRDAVLAEMVDHRRAVAEVADAIRQRLTARGCAEIPPPDEHPLARAALMVPDDLCVLVPGEGGWVLAGACLCSPSFWRLADKIGRPMPTIHGPVPGLEAALGHRVAQFLDRLPVGRIFERRNWNIHRNAERFHPQPENWDPPPTEAECARLQVRSERQTLRRVDADSLLFTIAVSVHPLAEIRDHPAAMVDMLAAIEGMSGDERASFGYRHHGAALTLWLRRQIDRAS
jgi:hypothetical protein